VLVIDDDPKVISLYRRYLLQHNYEIVAVTDPTQAVARARETRPCAITLDIMMPGKDGWQVLNDLKQDPSTKSIPIIICSLLDETAKAYSQGAASYLVKPFLQEDMLNALGKRNQSGAIRNVLVIDDDPADLRLVEKMLGDETNLRVTLAEGGSRGWNHIQQQPPDAVIMDLFMPDLNGFTLLERMRADNTLRDIPVILLTGADLSPELHQQLTNLGQGVLPKGYLHEKELLSFLEEALRKIRPNGKNGHSS
jgi:CheY-like chemotaxis protein